MKELKIYEFQAKQIEDTLRLMARITGAKEQKTSFDRDVMQAWATIKNIINSEPDKIVHRFDPEGI